jgi:dTDP-4-dehydrorhamnose reductase
MLGTDVCRAFLAGNHEVTPVTSADFDIADTTATRLAIMAVRPEIVVHTAAYTDVDGCERDPDSAYRINAIGTWNVATASAEARATLVHISTDYVFDGEKGTPYIEFDKPNPLGVYGASKLAAEDLARQACPKHYIIRSSWLFGPNGKCFPKVILRLAETKKEIAVVADQIGMPTYTPDLADAIIELLTTPLYGLYHITNTGSCSWHQLAEAVLMEAGRSDIVLNPIRSVDWPSPTRRPKYSVLRNYARELRGMAPLRPWQEGLKDFMNAIKQTQSAS